jgi:hypothetical protein
MFIQKIKMLFLLSAGILLLAGCGTETKTEYVRTSAPASTYLVEYIPGTTMSGTTADATTGKTTFKLRVRNRSTFAAASGLTMTVYPLMHMSSMNHSAPADVVTESISTPGTYDCAIYYLMASGTGSKGGYWELQVKIGSETATFYPSVGMAMGTDTVRATLYGSDDVVSSMSGTQLNKYFLFNDGPVVSGPTSTFSLFISHSEDMIMNFKPAYEGAAMGSPTGLVTSMTVTAFQDTTFTTPLPAVHSGNGHWTVSGLTGLVSSQTTTIYVKMALNGQDKTTDGMVSSPTSTNYATFTVTPQ